MKALLTLVSTLVLALCLAGVGWGAPPSPTALAKAALALSDTYPSEGVGIQKFKRYATCKCGTNCVCEAGECGDVNCPSLFTTVQLLDYKRAYYLALAEDRPLCIWVGQCPPAGKGWAAFVHTRDDKYERVKSPGVVLGKPNGKGGLDCVYKIKGLPTLRVVKEFLGDDVGLCTTGDCNCSVGGDCTCGDNCTCGSTKGGSTKSKPAKTKPTASPQVYYPASMPTFTPSFAPSFRPMPMMGGFGGGFGGGGGCGGGR